MKLRSGSLSIFANVATTSAAHARLIEINPDWIWIQHADGSIVGYNTLIVFLFGLLILLGIAAAISLVTSNSRSCYATTYTANIASALNAAHWHEQEAARLQALKRQMDAETELTASLIKKARTDAEYGELTHIADHAREVGRLKREL